MAHATNKLYWWIAFVLAVVTALEVAYPYVTEGYKGLDYYYMPVLAIMSAIKFFLVVAYFMHLKYDQTILSWILILSLILVCLISTGLLLLYGVIRWY
jgi:cytochrome c oxidase subunit 4